MRFASGVACIVYLFASIAYAQNSKKPKNCPQINQSGDHSFRPWNKPAENSCHAVERNGFPMPDPKCTPGAFNPSLKLAVLKNPDFRTGCVRNDTTTEDAKAETYNWYSISHPTGNEGENQTCELDHLVPLYLGGADTLDNIWPQCGPDGAALDDRYFKEKDKVEYYLGRQVRAGTMSLSAAQRGIANDWTQYLSKAKKFCSSGKCDFRGQ
ncbi:MAG TPA: HNH endonuclease signature motif containing protein [Terriglobales bacterium]|nr:HNH endonuclease signature motif containing protein [Terriglobales bacterium]